MDSKRILSAAGLRQAAIVFLGILLLCPLIVLIFHSEFIDSIWRGPGFALLFNLDISNTLCYALWLSSLPVYWLVLGMVAWPIACKICQPKAEPPEVQPPKWAMRLGMVALSVAIEIALSIPIGIFTETELIRLAKPHPNQSIANAIINHLRQIDAAKAELALEKKVSPDYVPTEADLLEYIKPDKKGKLPHVGPERYVLNAINEEPYAIFDKGWRMSENFGGMWSRYVITNGTVCRLP
ncbi:MAG: hypothetical protein ABSE16_11610 [Verrucomicrobiota bacterium]